MSVLHTYDAEPAIGPVEHALPTPSSEVELFSLAGHDGYLRGVNEAFADLVGLRHEDIDGRSLLELVHPDDLPQIVAGLAALEAGAQEVLLENRFMRHDASAVHLEWVARPVPGSDLWWAAGRDVTKFHVAVAQTVDLRARFDLAVGSVAACMWEFDVRTQQLTWETEAVHVFGVAGRQLPDTFDDLAALVHPDDRTAVATMVAALRQHAGTTDIGFRVGDGPMMKHLSMRGKVITHDRRDRAQRAVGILIDVTAEKAMEEQMLRMVMSDALTGVPNRRAFDQALRNDIRRCNRNQLPISVLMIDVDNFKRFNDTFGHLVGDDALCAVARSLQGVIARAGDTLARFGGEEFTVILPDTSNDSAVIVADRLLHAVRAATVRQAPDWPISVSIGIATWNPGDDPLRPVDLMSRADLALYAAKAAGKDRAASHRELPDNVTA
jgi:diguanylate cyclase (GGDEF)-like protein/PAS domain S-box-containing protein